MSLDNYLSSLRGSGESEPGTFTLSEERARLLLSEKALADVWQSWLCLCQGFHRLGASSISVDVSSSKVSMKVGFPQKTDRETLLSDERMMLGWLTVGWFGSPYWVAEESRLEVQLKGGTWRRYRWASSLARLLQSALAYSTVEVSVNGSSVRRANLPVGVSLSLFPARTAAEGGLHFLDFGQVAQAVSERRTFPLDGDLPEGSDLNPRALAALASKERASWSEITWVNDGVVIAQERNTLERPGIAAVASANALGLETDLSGFKVIHDEATMAFLRQLKRDVLWML